MHIGGYRVVCNIRRTMPDQPQASPTTPQLRTAEKDGARRTTWAELLNDLVFTAIVAQLAQRLLTSLSGPSLGGFFLLYVPVWWLWNGEAHYSTRFDNERDVVHRFLGSLQLLGLIGLAATIPRALELDTSSIIYALTYSAVRVLLLIEYGRAWFYVPEARPYIRHITTGFAVSVLIWIVSAFVPVPYRYGLWAMALLIELSTPLPSAGGFIPSFCPMFVICPSATGSLRLFCWDRPSSAPPRDSFGVASRQAPYWQPCWAVLL